MVFPFGSMPHGQDQRLNFIATSNLIYSRWCFGLASGQESRLVRVARLISMGATPARQPSVPIPQVFHF